MINKNISHIFIIFSCLLGLVFMPLNSAQAQSSLDAKMILVRDNCTNAKMIAVQLQKRDAVSRINRGRAYDQLLRQVQAINSRFTYNKLDSTEITNLANDLQDNIDKFRTGYTAYDDSLSNAIKTDCKQSPETFYDYIVKSRQKREELSNSIKQINAWSSTYRSALEKYQKSIDPIKADL